MKKFIIALTILIVLTALILIPVFLLNPSFELLHSGVTIVKVREVSDSYIVEDDQQNGSELIPTVLYYNFSLRNSGLQLKKIKEEDLLEAKIVPKDTLKAVSDEVLGINLYDQSGRFTFDGMLPASGKSSKLILIYRLNSEKPQSEISTPSEEQLQRLLNTATDAYLVIMINKKEIERFDLNYY